MDVSRIFPSCCPISKASSNSAFCGRNVWGPHRQPALIDMLSMRYKFSPRLQAIIRSPPRKHTDPSHDKNKHASRFSRPKASQKDDPEIALTNQDEQLPKAPSAASSVAPTTIRNHNNEVDHYTLAEQMRHYHALDGGPQCNDPFEPK